MAMLLVKLSCHILESSVFRYIYRDIKIFKTGKPCVGKPEKYTIIIRHLSVYKVVLQNHLNMTLGDKIDEIPCNSMSSMFRA